MQKFVALVAFLGSIIGFWNNHILLGIVLLADALLFAFTEEDDGPLDLFIDFFDDLFDK